MFSKIKKRSSQWVEWFSYQLKRKDLKWHIIIAVAVFHLAALATFVQYWNKAKITTYLFGWFYTYVGIFGITAGGHRLWAHRSYKATTPLKIILLTCYASTGLYSLKKMVRDHRIHHKYSDTDADPHNSKRGFFFSHIGWLMQERHQAVVEAGNKLDITDISDDPLLEFYDRHYDLIRLFFGFILPVVINTHYLGESLAISFCWLTFIRFVHMLNITFMVNSVAHVFGSKPYDNRIFPGENGWLSIIVIGEGWHNYHHLFPWDYQTGEWGGYSINLTTFWIDLFAKIGWAYDLKKPSDRMIKAHAQKYGNGHGHVHHEVPEEELLAEKVE